MLRLVGVFFGKSPWPVASIDPIFFDFFLHSWQQQRCDVLVQVIPAYCNIRILKL